MARRLRSSARAGGTSDGGVGTGLLGEGSCGVHGGAEARGAGEKSSKKVADDVRTGSGRSGLRRLIARVARWRGRCATFARYAAKTRREVESVGERAAEEVAREVSCTRAM